MMQWYTVYDFATRGPRIGQILSPLLFVAIGLLIYFKANQHTAETPVPLRSSSKRQQGKWGGLVFAALGGMSTLVSVPGLVRDYTRTRAVYTQKRYALVQGSVRNFKPMPVGGHKLERFMVNDVRFAFSDFDETDYGYNQAASHGGAIRAGLQVRIAYFNNGNRNVILKLDTLAAAQLMSQ